MSELYTGVSTEAIKIVLGIEEEILESAEAMFQALEFSFFPKQTELSPLLNTYYDWLYHFLIQELGNEKVRQFDIESERLKPHVAYIFAGNDKPEHHDLPVPVDYYPENNLTAIKHIPVISITEKPPEFNSWNYDPEYIDACNRMFTWQMANEVLWIGKKDWTLSTLNISKPTHSWNPDLINLTNTHPDYLDFKDGFIETVATKTQVLVTPPDLNDFNVYTGNETLEQRTDMRWVQDIIASGPLLKKSGMYPSMRKVSDFDFRVPLHRRIASVYLDERSGMSYGFVVKQAPTKLELLLRRDEMKDRLQSEGRTITMMEDDFFTDNQGDIYLKINIPEGKLVPHGEEGEYFIRVPEVWVYSSRSGSDKTNLLTEDIIKMGIAKGQMKIELLQSQDALPHGFRPSFDTKVILGHAVANAVYASVLKHFNPDATFVKQLETEGWALGHYHGYRNPKFIPYGWVIAGEHNINVPCSAPHTGVFGFRSVEEAVMLSLIYGFDLKGIDHIESMHGENNSCPSLISYATNIGMRNRVAFGEHNLHLLREYTKQNPRYKMH